MYVRTPGFRLVDPAAIDLRRDRPGLVGVVLRRYNPATGVSMAGGPRATVLLLGTLQELPDVLVTCEGGHSQNIRAVPCTPTADDLLADYEAAKAANTAIPDPANADPRWGSRVVVSRLSNGQPFIAHYLYPAGLPAKRLPVLPQGGSPGDQAAAAAVAALVATPYRMPDAISDPSSIPVQEPPGAFASPSAVRLAWQRAYPAGWLAGAEAAYFGQPLQDASGAYGGPLAAPQADGWRQGAKAGPEAGAAVLAATPPAPQDDQSTPPADFPDTPAAADQDNGPAQAAITAGPDCFWEHYGSRMIFLAAGGIILDSQAGGPIAIQGGQNRVRITAGGASWDVGGGSAIQGQALDIGLQGAIDLDGDVQVDGDLNAAGAIGSDAGFSAGGEAGADAAAVLYGLVAGVKVPILTLVFKGGLLTDLIPGPVPLPMVPAGTIQVDVTPSGMTDAAAAANAAVQTAAQALLAAQMVKASDPAILAALAAQRKAQAALAAAQARGAAADEIAQIQAALAAAQAAQVAAAALDDVNIQIAQTAVTATTAAKATITAEAVAIRTEKAIVQKLVAGPSAIAKAASDLSQAASKAAASAAKTSGRSAAVSAASVQFDPTQKAAAEAAIVTAAAQATAAAATAAANATAASAAEQAAIAQAIPAS